jgi:hypothetical protein
MGKAVGQNDMNVQVIRRIAPIRAFLAGLFGVGSGYVPGDLRLALASVFGILALLEITRVHS